MGEFKDRRHDDRDMKELFETKLEVLDARYKNIGLQNEKLDSKIDRIFQTYDERLRSVETFIHGHGMNKGALVRLEENESDVREIQNEMRPTVAGPGLINDVANLKQYRKKRDHVWALMGGLASGFAIWLLTKFGDSSWEMLASKWQHSEPAKIAASHIPRRRRITYVIRHHAEPPAETEAAEEPDAQ